MNSSFSQWLLRMLNEREWSQAELARRSGLSRTAISDPQQHKDHPRRIVSPFILSGVLFCQECGSPMSGYSIKRWDYYVCSRRQRKHDCHSRRIPRGPIESAVMDLLTERMLTLENLLLIQAEIQNAWTEHSTQSDQSRRDIEKQLHGVTAKIRNITSAISDLGHSKALLHQLNALEMQEGEYRAALDKLDNMNQPVKYSPPQLTDIAAAVTAELNSDDINKKRAALRGIVSRVIAKRTDDQILGVMYCNQVNGHVPPRGDVPKTLLYPISIPIKKHKAPITK